MAKKKRTGLLVAAGCGLLLCLPLCAGAIGGAGGLVYWLSASEDMASFEMPSEFDPAAMMDDFMPAESDEGATTTAFAFEDDTPQDDEVAEGQEGGDLENDEAVDEELFDSGLVEEDGTADLGGEEEVGEARIVIEEDGGTTVTNTRPQPKPSPSSTDTYGDRDVMADLAALDDMDMMEDEEDFDDIAAEIAALDSLDDLDDEPTKKSAPSDKPGTIKVSGDYDRASIIGSDGVYRGPGKFDPGTYRVEITMEDGSVINKTVKLKGGQTVKFKCDVDAGDCSR